MLSQRDVNTCLKCATNAFIAQSNVVSSSASADLLSRDLGVVQTCAHVWLVASEVSEVILHSQSRWQVLERTQICTVRIHVLFLRNRQDQFCSDVFAKEVDRFGFSGIQEYLVFNPFEAQIDTGNMMQALLKEAVSKNIDLKKSLSESVRKEIVSMVSEGLTDTETEKFTALVEELSYDDEDSFKVKVQTIRENYFTGKQSTLVESVVTDSPVDEINENKYVNVDPTVAAYAKALQQYNN